MKKQFLIIFLLIALAGCFGGGAEIPQDSFYRLSEIKTTQKASPHFQIIAVTSLKSDALHHERAILYSDADQPLKIKRYHYHHWTQVPNELIQEHLIDYLQKTGIASQVVRYGEVVKTDAKISGYIKRFERIRTSGDIKVRVELELQLDTFTKQRQHYRWTYDVEKTAADTSMNASVASMSAALEEIYQRFVQDISRISDKQ
ncbi:MAG: ABC-type transport auxiliary lipoprotein family protein [Thioalkalispiraceae bacterium]|jgi:ABC-type uncharacterized transport system auxiliary subunit